MSRCLFISTDNPFSHKFSKCEAINIENKGLIFPPAVDYKRKADLAAVLSLIMIIIFLTAHTVYCLWTEKGLFLFFHFYLGV